MGGGKGTEWTRNQPVFPGGLRDSLTMFKQLEGHLAEGSLRTIHQVGCGSGREIAHFAHRYPQVSFIGSDLDDAIIGECRERWSDLKNLSFTVLGLDLLDTREMESLNVDLVFSSGSLTYLDEVSLRRFLGILRTMTKQVLFLENLSYKFDMQKDVHSTPNGDFAWNHSYTRYLDDEGWKDVSCVFDMIENRVEQNVSVSSVSD
jgi:SAM-dependent methyltransferase